MFIILFIVKYVNEKWQIFSDIKVKISDCETNVGFSDRKYQRLRSQDSNSFRISKTKRGLRVIYAEGLFCALLEIIMHYQQ